nr:hypothetical protein [Nocardioides alcanivorans]
MHAHVRIPGVNVPHSASPPNITSSVSWTPSVASSGSSRVTCPLMSSASSRWMSASCAWRRTVNPTVFSLLHDQAASRGSAATKAFWRAAVHSS